MIYNYITWESGLNVYSFMDLEIESRSYFKVTPKQYRISTCLSIWLNYHYN